MDMKIIILLERWFSELNYLTEMNIKLFLSCHAEKSSILIIFEFDDSRNI